MCLQSGIQQTRVNRHWDQRRAAVHMTPLLLLFFPNLLLFFFANAIHDLFLEKQIMDWELEARGDRDQGDPDHEDHVPKGQQSVDPLVDDIDR